MADQNQANQQAAQPAPAFDIQGMATAFAQALAAAGIAPQPQNVPHPVFARAPGLAERPVLLDVHRLEPLFQGEPARPLTDEHDVGRLLHHAPRDRDGVHDVAQEGDVERLASPIITAPSIKGVRDE